METYDAPMLDTGDPDIAMYPNSSPDMWLSVEASMTDHTIDTHSHMLMQQDSHPTIEVDMHDHSDEGIVEYEMADDLLGYDFTTGDLLDVDVRDASRIHSPVVAPVADHSLFTPLEMPSLLSTPVPLPALELHPIATSSSHHSATTGQEDNATVLVADVPHAPMHDTQSQPDVPAFAALQEQGVAAPSAFSAEDPIQIPSEEIRLESTGHSVQGEQVDHEEHAIEGHFQASQVFAAPMHETDDGAHEQNEERSAAVESEHIEIPETQAEQSDEHYEYYADHGIPEETAEETYYHESAEDHHDVVETTQDEAPKVKDPHEISDGIFIDPPPGVLLSLSADEFPDYSLFNQPAPASASASTASASASASASESASAGALPESSRISVVAGAAPSSNASPVPSL